MISRELRWSRFAIAGYFFILGTAFAVWGTRLPAVKESLHLSDGQLGLALFAMPAGSVLTLPVSGLITDRFGLLGAGLAAIFPQIVTVAAALDPAQSGRHIGRIAAVAYSGLLTGPVAIGAIASGTGLRNALLVPAALALVTAVAADVMGLKS